MRTSWTLIFFGFAARALIRGLDIANLQKQCLGHKPVALVSRVGELGEGVLRKPTSWVLGFLLTALFFAGRPRARRDLSRIALAARDMEKATAWLTLKALGMTVYIALAFPFLMSFVGYQLSSAHEADDFQPVRWAGDFLLAAERLLSRRSSNISAGATDWRRPTLPGRKRCSEVLRHNVLWVTQLLVPLAFIVGMAAAEGNTFYYNSLGRFASIAALLGIAAFFVRLLRPSGAIGSFLRARHLQHWVFRMRYLWYLFLVEPHHARKPCRRGTITPPLSCRSALIRPSLLILVHQPWPRAGHEMDCHRPASS